MLIQRPEENRPIVLRFVRESISPEEHGLPIILLETLSQTDPVNFSRAYKYLHRVMLLLVNKNITFLAQKTRLHDVRSR